jgi:hypothetical protein
MMMSTMQIKIYLTYQIEQVGVAVMLWPLICEMLDSNFSWDSGYF